MVWLKVPVSTARATSLWKHLDLHLWWFLLAKELLFPDPVVDCTTPLTASLAKVLKDGLCHQIFYQTP